MANHVYGGGDHLTPHPCPTVHFLQSLQCSCTRLHCLAVEQVVETRAEDDARADDVPRFARNPASAEAARRWLKPPYLGG